MRVLHALDKAGGPEEPPLKSLFDLIVADGDPFVEDEDAEILLDLVFSSAPQEREVVLDEGDIDLFPEGREGTLNVQRSTWFIQVSGSPDPAKGGTDQVAGELSMDDAQRASHVLIRARS